MPLSLCTYAFPILLCIVAEPVDGNNFGGHGTMRNDWGAGGYTKIGGFVLFCSVWLAG